jgi:hypothetical protein
LNEIAVDKELDGVWFERGQGVETLCYFLDFLIF